MNTMLTTIPHTPGVYIFRDINKHILYVGKAIDLYRRVASYFQGHDDRDKTSILVRQIATIKTIPTTNEFDAILLEALLIRTHRPKYNIIAKDDKSPLYVCFTLSEPLPHIQFMRENQIRKKTLNLKKDKYFGPFQSGRIAKMLMKTLRHIVPYCLERKRRGIPCFYTHIGLCNPCPAEIEKIPEGSFKHDCVKLYRSNITRLTNILSGHSKKVLQEMTQSMNAYGQSLEFEKAGELRNQIQNLQRLMVKRFDPTLYLANMSQAYDTQVIKLHELTAVLNPFFPTLKSLERIECIDISNLSGVHASGSLVVLTHGISDTSLYRRFKIRLTYTPNDVAMIKEVVRRRFNHTDWPYPNLLVIDGGKGQVRGALETMNAMHVNIPIVGLAKRNEDIIVPSGHSFHTLKLPYTASSLHILQRIRDEAHRFALSYHTYLRSVHSSRGILKNRKRN